MKLSQSSGKIISKTFSVKTIIEEHVFNSTAVSDKRIYRIPLILDKVQKIIKQLKKHREVTKMGRQRNMSLMGEGAQVKMV